MGLFSRTDTVKRSETVNGILKNTSLINSQASNTFGNDKKMNLQD